MRALGVILCCLVLWPGLAAANDKLVRLHVPEVLIVSGVLTYALPRFSLKTQVRTELTPDPGAADLVLGAAGTPLFEGLGQVWHMDIRSPDHPGTERLAGWFLSEVGQRTVQAFAPGGEALFAPPRVEKSAPVAMALGGDAALGHKVSRAKCTRCHAVDGVTRGWGIGSTPSFGILRALPDWEARFTAFYALNPHPAFTQVIELTEPFPAERPPPIAPIALTRDEFDALIAYVTAMKAADLGAPLKHQ